MIVDRTYAKALGVSGVGAVAEIAGQRVRVEGLTDGIRSFTTSPYIFTSMNNARRNSFGAGRSSDLLYC